jgi:hypothetical protein
VSCGCAYWDGILSAVAGFGYDGQFYAAREGAVQARKVVLVMAIIGCMVGSTRTSCCALIVVKMRVPAALSECEVK